VVTDASTGRAADGKPHDPRAVLRVVAIIAILPITARCGTGKISRIEVLTLLKRKLGVRTAFTQIRGMLRASSGPDTGRMAERYVVQAPPADL
jgi:hypothetical protein